MTHVPRDKDILALFKRLRSSIYANDRQAMSRALKELKSSLGVLADASKDQCDRVARTALGAGALKALEACIQVEPQHLADAKAACRVVGLLSISNVTINSVTKDRPSLVHAIIQLFEVDDPDAADTAMQALCRLPSSIAGGRLAADAGLIPKLVAQLGTCNSYGAAFTIRNFASLSGNRAAAAAKAGALSALAEVVFSYDPELGTTTKAQAAQTLTKLLEFLPGDKMPQNAELQQCAAVLVWRLRAGGEAAVHAGYVIRTFEERLEQQQTEVLMDALAKAGAAALLLQLARQRANSSSGGGGGSSSASGEQQIEYAECIHLLGMLLTDSKQPGLHDLVVRAGGVELAVQLALLSVPQLAKQPHGAQLKAIACLGLLASLMDEEPQLAAQVAEAGAVGPLLRAMSSSTSRASDRDLLRLVKAGVELSSDKDRHAKESLQAGAAQLIAHVLVQCQQQRQRQQQACRVALREAVTLAWLLSIAATAHGAAAISEEDAQALLPLVQPLVGLAMEPCGQEEEELAQSCARGVLQLMAQHSQPLMAAAAAAVERAQQQQQGQGQGIAALQVSSGDGADSSTAAGAAAAEGAAAGSSGGGADVLPVTPVSDQDPEGHKACAACGAGSKPNGKGLMQCSACLEAWYCSATCQRKHWKVHRKRCAGHRARQPASRQ